jgi:hypothetical protein
MQAAANTPNKGSTVEARLAEARTRRAALESPTELKAIFDQLCSRLDGLLTTEQKVPGEYALPKMPKIPRRPSRTN